MVIKVEKDRFVISVGLDCLVQALNFKLPQPIRDPKEFLKDFIAELENEGDTSDGSTALHCLLDDAAYNVFESGSLAFAE